jgi:protein SCO1/2
MRRWSPALALALLAAAACEGAQEYQVRGVVQEVRPEWKQVVIAHEEIPGFMPAMTMNFDVPDPALLARLEKGQALSFTLETDRSGYRVVAADVLGKEELERIGGMGAFPHLRDPAPSFALTDEDGAEVSLASLAGKIVVLDFIYTHCPGPCPILTGKLVELQRALPPELAQKVHFVSITLDPARDTPEVLRAYGAARGADLARWSFLSGPPAALAAVADAFGVGSLRREDGEIDHVVAAFGIDARGRIAERWIGLEHAPAVMLSDLARIADAG